MGFLDIDPLALDVEWVKQPKLLSHYMRKLADAKQELEEAKNNAEITRCELDRDIRSNYEQYGLEKITETIVANTIVIQDEYCTALKEVNDCKHAVDVLNSAVNGLEHKKRALESLVKLHSMDYFAEPITDTDGGESLEKTMKKGARTKGRNK